MFNFKSIRKRFFSHKNESNQKLPSILTIKILIFNFFKELGKTIFEILYECMSICINQFLLSIKNFTKKMI